MVEVLVDWALLALVGVLVLTPLRRAHWRVWLPAAPAVGAAFLAVTLHLTSGFAPIWVGLIVVVLLLAGLVFYGLRQGRRPWRVGWWPWVGLGAVLVVGLPGAVAALLPNLYLGNGSVVAAGSTTDSFFYVAEANWLRLHAMYPVIRPTPVMGGVFIPGYGPAFNAVRINIRMGQSMIQALTDFVTGRQAVQSAMSWMACYVVITGGAAVTAARLLRVRPVAAWLLAVMVPSSAVLVYMVRQQNQDSLLGLSLALLAGAAVLASADRRAPRVMAALMVAGLVACYVELSLFVAPMIVLGLVGRPWARVLPALRRGGEILGLAVLFAPLAWWRGLHSLFGGGGADNFPSPYLGVGLTVAVGRLVGASSVNSVPSGGVTWVLALVVIVGVVAAVLASRYRAAWAGLLLIGGGYVAWTTIRHMGYTQSRVTSLVIPLAVVMAVAGWDELAARGWPRLAALMSPRRVRPAALGLLSVAAIVALVWPISNLHSAGGSYSAAVARSRWVDPSYAAVSTWVIDHGGPQGSSVTVIVPDLFAQTWVASALRDDPGVQYPSFNPSYTSVNSFTGDRPTRYLVTGRGALVQAAPEAAVFRAGEFTVWDTTRGSVVIATQHTGFGWRPYANPRGGVTGTAGASGIAVFRSPSAPNQIVLQMTSAGGTPYVMSVGPTAAVGETVRLTRAASEVPVEMGGRALVFLRTSVVPKPARGALPEEFALTGVSAGN